MRLANDRPSFTPVHSRIRAIGPRDLHLWKGRGLTHAWPGISCIPFSACQVQCAVTPIAYLRGLGLARACVFNNHFSFSRSMAAHLLMNLAGSGGPVLHSIVNPLQHLVPRHRLAQAGRDPSESFTIFCDPNAGGTGECYRSDNNDAIACTYASQDFIRCRSRSGLASTCMYYSPNQFVCKENRGAVIGKDWACKDALTTDLCRPPLRDEYTDKMRPGNLDPKSTQLAPSNGINSDAVDQDVVPFVF